MLNKIINYFKPKRVHYVKLVCNHISEDRALLCEGIGDTYSEAFMNAYDSYLPWKSTHTVNAVHNHSITYKEYMKGK